MMMITAKAKGLSKTTAMKRFGEATEMDDPAAASF